MSEQFHVRVWSLASEIVNVNSNSHPIGHDVVMPEADQVFDAVVNGDYMMAGDVRARLSVAGGELVSGELDIVWQSLRALPPGTIIT